MFHWEDSNDLKKSPLGRADFLYENESESDVIFLVGLEPDVWRIPGHRKILSEANEVFRALMEGPLATRDQTVVVEDVEGRAFDYLLRYLYGKEVCFRSATTALSTLYAAHKYLCPGLIELCVEYLDLNLNTRNVLDIYVHARLYAVGEGRTEGLEPSAPEAEADTCHLHAPGPPGPPGGDGGAYRKNSGESRGANPIGFWSEALVHNCLEHIDENAEQVLDQEDIEDLSAENLREIIRRDTLKVKSEYQVFLALDRWANRECKRRKLNLNPKNRRSVLRELIYEIRFPFLTPEEFVSGPIRSGWLDQREMQAFSGVISKSAAEKRIGGRLLLLVLLPAEWKSHADKISRRRVHGGNESVRLSRRTGNGKLLAGDSAARREEKNSKRKKNFFVFKKKSKRENNSGKLIGSEAATATATAAGEKKNLSGSEEGERRNCCSKCFRDFLLDLLLCLFD